MSTVQYLPVKGPSGYRVGDDGSVWSRRRSGPGSPTGEWRRLRCREDEHGYLHVMLGGRGGTWFQVHRVVLEAFVGPCPPGMEARHFPDRDPSNNALTNLSWATHEANMRDKIVHGTQAQGTSNGSAKLTDDRVRSIRADHATGRFNFTQLAHKYGVNRCRISDVVHRRSWTHV